LADQPTNLPAGFYIIISNLTEVQCAFKRSKKNLKALNCAMSPYPLEKYAAMNANLKASEACLR